MKTIYRIIFWSALFVLGLCSFIPLIRAILNLEFASDTIKSNYQEFLFYAVPSAILLTLFGTLKSDNRIAFTLGKIIGTMVIALGSIFIMAMLIFTDLCTWTDKEILYEYKNDTNTRIIVRDFGCGATDSSPPNVVVFKITTFSKYLIRASKVDTNEIDKKDWVKNK